MIRQPSRLNESAHITIAMCKVHRTLCLLLIDLAN